jgi:hypothetical protein
MITNLVKLLIRLFGWLLAAGFLMTIGVSLANLHRVFLGSYRDYDLLALPANIGVTALFVLLVLFYLLRRLRHLL